MKERDQPKNAEPISLYPLKPNDAMRGLLAVKPQPKPAKPHERLNKRKKATKKKLAK